VLPDYALAFLKSPHFLLNGEEHMTGSAGQKRVPWDYFARTPFPLPPLAEQRRIVAKVEELLALCDELEARQTTAREDRTRLVHSALDHLTSAKDEPEFREHVAFILHNSSLILDSVPSLRQAILSLAVQGRLVPQDLNEEPGSELLDRLRTEVKTYAREHGLPQSTHQPIANGSLPHSIPSGWAWARLSWVFKVITDGDHLPPPKSENGFAFLTIGNITTGRLDFSHCRFVPEKYLKSIADYRRPQLGDILYTVVGATYGRPALVDTERPFCVQRHIAILKPSCELDVRFLTRLLSSPLVYEQATRSTTGTAQPTIPLGSLRNFLIPLPPLAEQQRIVAKVEELMRWCDGLEAQLTAGRTTGAHLLDATLRQLLTS